MASAEQCRFSWLHIHCFVAVLAAGCYVNSLSCGFVFDDISAVVENKDVVAQTPLTNLLYNDFWGTSMKQDRSHKSYRPICVLTYRINYALGGLDPRGYHAVNLLLHVVVCQLFLRVCRRIVFNEHKPRCTAAAAVFAAHPVHTEAVTGVVGRAELLSAVFALLALQFYVRAAATTATRPCTQLVLCLCTAACIFCATFSKEQGITIIGVCGAYEILIVCKVSFSSLSALLSRVLRWNAQSGHLDQGAVCARHGGSGTLIRLGSLLLTAAVTLGVRLQVMGSELPVFMQFDNPAASAPSPTRQLTYNYLLPLNAWLLLNPSQLLCDWTMGTVPLVRSWLDPRNAATVVFYVLLARLACAAAAAPAVHANPRSRPALVMGLAFTVMPFLPASNLFFPVGFVVAERILYMPSLGYCILLAESAFCLQLHLAARWAVPRHAVATAVTLLVALFACKTFVRNYDWVTERALFISALRVTGNNAKIYNNIGHTYEAEQQHDVALAYFRAAASKQPDDIGSHLNVGRALAALEQPAEAESAFRAALSLMPAARRGQVYSTRVAAAHLNVYVSLANLVAKDAGRLHEADALYRSAISMRPDFTEAYINRGSVLMQLQQHSEAARMYELALQYGWPSADDIYYNLGVVHLSTGRLAEALGYFDKAIEANPNHKLSLYNSASLIQESAVATGVATRRPEALARLNRLHEIDPTNEKAYFTHGLLATDMLDYADAHRNFLRAIELKTDFKGALFNIALLLVNNMNRPIEAQPYLEQCLRYHPHHVKSLILLADINLMQLNDTDAAEKNLRAILDVEPEHVQAEHNLCMLLVRRSQLSAAERCLAQLSRRAPPSETYVADHLTAVRARLGHGTEPPAGSRLVPAPGATAAGRLKKQPIS